MANAIQLLKIFSDEKPEIGISELAKRLGVAKSTAHRIATTLVNDCMLEQNARNKKYSLGLGLFELASRVRRKLNVNAKPDPLMESAALCARVSAAGGRSSGATRDAEQACRRT